MKPVTATLATILLTAAFLQVSHGLGSVLWPVAMVSHSMSGLAIGLAGGAFGAGFMMNCLLAPYVVRSVGHVRAYMVNASLWSVVLLAFPALIHPATWIAFTFCLGAFVSGTSTVLDAWVSSVSTPKTRGRVLSVYMVAVRLSSALGVLLLSLGDPAKAWLFMLGAAMISLSTVPVGLLRITAPVTPPPSMLGPVALMRISPVGALGAICTGFSNATTIQLLPLYGIAQGYDKNDISFVVSATLILSMGAAVIVGFLSDRIERRLLLVCLALIAAVACLALLVFGSPTFSVLMAQFLFWSAGSLSLYPVIIAHSLDRAEAHQTTPVVASLLLFWASGATLGPVIVGWNIAQFGPTALPASVGAVFVAFILLILARIVVRGSVGKPKRRLTLFPQPSLLLTRLLGKRVYLPDSDNAPPGVSPDTPPAEPAREGRKAADTASGARHPDKPT